MKTRHWISAALKVSLTVLIVVGNWQVQVFAAGTSAPPQSIRLGIVEFTAGRGTESLRPFGKEVVDLLPGLLSAEPGLVMVERSALDRVFKEATLSLSSGAEPDKVVKYGKMLEADWLLLGTFLKGPKTNYLLARIAETKTGKIRDLASFPAEGRFPLNCATLIAKFIAASKASTQKPSDHLFLAIGSFQDLSLYQRHPSFAEQIRGALLRHYAGSRVRVLEPEVSPLLQELRLGLGGFITDPATASQTQPAFVLVDGFYQSYQDEQLQFNVVLRVESLGGQLRTFSLKALPGNPVEAKVTEALDQAIRQLPSFNTPPSRQKGAQDQLQRGKQLIRAGDKFEFGILPNLLPTENYRETRVPLLRDAIAAFENAMFLDPGCSEAKFFLAECLADPHINQREQARDYWREAAGSTNASLARVARFHLASSYGEEDDRLAIELITGLRRETQEPEYLRQYDRALKDVYLRLGSAGKVSRESIIEAVTQSWRTDCRFAEWLASQGKRINAYEFFEVPENFYYHAFKESLGAMPTHVAGVVTNLTQEFPNLTPYLVGGFLRWHGQVAPAPWMDWYLAVLSQCEQAPANLFEPASFYPNSLWRDFTHFLRRRNYAVADRIAALLQQHGRSYLGRATQDELDLYTGYLHFQQERWQAALAAFERIGNREVPIDFEGPWGKGQFASARLAAERCREKLAAGNPAVPARTDTPGARVSIPSPAPDHTWPGLAIVFTVFGGKVWVVDAGGVIWAYTPGIRDAQKMAQLPPGKPLSSTMVYNNPACKIVAVNGTLWIATWENGVFAFDPATKAFAHYSVEQGLFTPAVSALLPTRDRVWIGFHAARGGAMGYLLLPEKRFVGIMLELPADLVRAPARGPYSGSLEKGAGATRGRVSGFAQSPGGQLWALSENRVLRYDPAPANRWQAVPLDYRGWLSQIVAHDQHVVLTSQLVGSWSSAQTNFGGLLIFDPQRGQCRCLSTTEGLPNNDLDGVALAGNKAWAGGRGFVARVDLPTARLEQVCQLPGTHRVNCVEIANDTVWFSAGPLLYHLPKDGTAERSPKIAANAAEPPATLHLTDSVTQPAGAPGTARDLYRQISEKERLYGGADAEPVRQTAKQFRAVVRAAAKDFPLLEPSAAKAPQGFHKLNLNRRGTRLDGFRLKNNSPDPRNFVWVFACEEPTSLETWFILPAEEQPTKGLVQVFPPKLHYTNAPWSGLPGNFREGTQYLRDGSILPGKEYILWFLFSDDRPNTMYMGFKLLPVTEIISSRTVIDQALGLEGPLRPSGRPTQAAPQ